MGAGISYPLQVRRGYVVLSQIIRHYKKEKGRKGEKTRWTNAKPVALQIFATLNEAMSFLKDHAVDKQQASFNHTKRRLTYYDPKIERWVQVFFKRRRDDYDGDLMEKLVPTTAGKSEAPVLADRMRRRPITRHLTNGAKRDLEFQVKSLPPRRNTARRAASRAARALTLAATRSNQFWQGNMKPSEVMALIAAALQDEFTPMLKMEVRQGGDHFTRVFTKMKQPDVVSVEPSLSS